MRSPSPADLARPGWTTARAIGAAAERVAALTVDDETARAMLRRSAEEMGGLSALRENDPRFALLQRRVASCPPCVFFDRARDAAAAFGAADAAGPTFEVMAALIEGIRIIDDIQDDETSCLAVELGVARALRLAAGALALALELTAALPLHGASWRAAANAIGRGLRETAIGQELEVTAAGEFESFWNVVDRKTAPLVATALELGTLAAGAEPAQAAALTQLAVPFGRVLQIGDDCIDALDPDSIDWRTPQHNLLMLYALSGPRAAEIEALLANAGEPETLRALRLALLRDGALAYAIHAQLTTLAGLSAAIDGLALPHPAPLLAAVEHHRAAAESLLRRSGVDAKLAASVTSVT